MPVTGCPCDTDGSGFVDSNDLFRFFEDYNRNDADFDGNGVTDSQDFFAFLVCYLNPAGSGC